MKLKRTGLTDITLLASLMFLLTSVFVVAPSLASNSDFQQALKSQGWDVKQAEDGTLTLRPPQQQGENSDTKKETGKERGSDGINQSMEGLQKQLEASGWSVSRDDDGSLVFHMLENVDEESPQTLSTNMPKGLEGLVDNPRWRVEHSDDGSLLLFPVAPDGKEQAVQLKITAGVSVAANFVLPVDEWAEASSIATSWLENTGKKGLTTGKIRKILRIYLVSIVQDAAPFALEHQIAIRQSDGHVIVLN